MDCVRSVLVRRGFVALVVTLVAVFAVTAAPKKRKTQEPLALISGTVFQGVGFSLPGAKVVAVSEQQRNIKLEEIVPNLVEGGRAAVLKPGSLRESSKPFTTKEGRNVHFARSNSQSAPTTSGRSQRGAVDEVIDLRRDRSAGQGFWSKCTAENSACSKCRRARGDWRDGRHGRGVEIRRQPGGSRGRRKEQKSWIGDLL